MLPLNALRKTDTAAWMRPAAAALLFPLAGCAAADRVAGLSTYANVASTLQQCGVPGACGTKLSCEGKTLAVTALIDAANVFDRRRYPSLPQEKFSLIDVAGGAALEIWSAPSNSGGLLSAQTGHPVEASVRGVAVGVDLPIASNCIRTIHLELNSPSDLIVGRKK